MRLSGVVTVLSAKSNCLRTIWLSVVPKVLKDSDGGPTIEGPIEWWRILVLEERRTHRSWNSVGVLESQNFNNGMLETWLRQLDGTVIAMVNLNAKVGRKTAITREVTFVIPEFLEHTLNDIFRLSKDNRIINTEHNDAVSTDE